MSHITHGEHTYGTNYITTYQWGEGSKLNIGKYCSIAENCKVFLGGNHRVDWISTFPFGEQTGSNGDVNIGNDVWIGHGVTIMSGIIIGDGVVIAANSHVVKNVEPYAMVGGNPAELIKYRFDKTIIDCLLELQWWDLPEDAKNEIKKDLCAVPDHSKLISWIEKYKKN